MNARAPLDVVLRCLIGLTLFSLLTSLWPGISGRVTIISQSQEIGFRNAWHRTANVENIEWGQLAKLTAASGTERDAFGFSVGIDGDTIVVGAAGVNNEQGAVYIFNRPAGGWRNTTPNAVLTPSDGMALDWFGYSVAIHSDVILVGAPGGPTGGPADRPGAAYIFVRPAGGWEDMHQTAKLSASNGAVDDRFGISVGLSQDTAVIGAMRHDSGGNVDQGMAYIFSQPAQGWADHTETARLTAAGGSAYDSFGLSVAIQGDTVVVGAPGYTPSDGATFVFLEPVGGWANATENAVLRSATGSAENTFGFSVATNGEAVVVGDPHQTTGDGMVYVFARPVAGWVDSYPTAIYTGTNGASHTIGWSVSIEGDTLAAGNMWDAAFVFTRTGSNLGESVQATKIVALDSEDEDIFGASVATNGQQIVVGSYLDDLDSAPDRGSASVFGYDPFTHLFLPVIQK